MKRLTLTAMALFLASTSLSHAEMMQAQPLINSHFDTPNLAGDMLSRTEKTSTSPLFSLSTPTVAVSKAATALQNTPTTAVTLNVLADATASTEESDDSSLMDRMGTLASQTMRTVRSFNQSGRASYYGNEFNGRKTASGERFDMNAMTAAHRSLPLSCYIRVTNQDNGKSVIVKVNDRGPFHGKRILDLSYGAAQKLGITQRGTGNVTIERIDAPSAN
jgi:rare lipoprotein A